ncbi:hypothetical protein DFJ73DRAFT_138105 [Zopfochytrium polystomum]|nr:hypothetical protein DFJ73DRAFT_138105 [Zopfochytrium polystomum]
MVSSASSSAGPSTTCLLQPASSSQGSADALSPLAGSLPVSDHKFSQPLPPPAPPTPLPPPLPQQQSCQHQPPHQFHHQQQQQRHRPMSLASLVSSVEPNVTPSASRPPAQLEHRPPIHLGDSRPLGPPAGASALPNGRAEYENSPPAMAKTINSNDNNQLPHIAEALGFNSQQPQLPLQDHHAFVQSSSGAPERQVILGSRSHHDAVRDDDPFPPVDCDANVSSARRPSIRDALHPYSHSAPVALKIGPPLVHPLQNSRRSNSPISRNWTRSRCAEADDSPPPAADPLWYAFPLSLLHLLCLTCGS